MVKDSSLPIKIDKILKSMQDGMASGASKLRDRVMAGTLPAADAANEADKMYEDLRGKATQDIIDHMKERGHIND